MDFYSSEISKLIEELSQLPGMEPRRRRDWHFIS